MLFSIGKHMVDFYIPSEASKYTFTVKTSINVYDVVAFANELNAMDTTEQFVNANNKHIIFDLIINNKLYEVTCKMDQTHANITISKLENLTDHNMVLEMIQTTLIASSGILDDFTEPKFYVNVHINFAQSIPIDEIRQKFNYMDIIYEPTMSRYDIFVIMKEGISFFTPNEIMYCCTFEESESMYHKLASKFDFAIDSNIETESESDYIFQVEI